MKRYRPQGTSSPTTPLAQQALRRQPLLLLAADMHPDTFDLARLLLDTPSSAQLAAGFGRGTATAYRYVAEAVDVLASFAPALTEAVETASTKAFVILDGTLLPIDRVAADRPFRSGKHKKHGMNVQVIAYPHGRLLWASPALPGAVHGIEAARTHGIIDALEGVGVECWADSDDG